MSTSRSSDSIMQPAADKLWLTVTDARALASCSHMTVRRAMDAGMLLFHKSKSSKNAPVRFYRANVEAWIKRGQPTRPS